jgi:putative ABC transport system ATP-binding protein
MRTQSATAREIALREEYGAGAARATAKFTLMHCLTGLDRPDSGQVLLGDTELDALPEDAPTRLHRRRSGVLSQPLDTTRGGK